MNNQFNNIFNKNRIVLENLNDLDQNMANLLNIRSTLIYKNCKNININIDSKINHINLKNCTNFIINVSSLISGFKLEKCENIYINLKNCENMIEIDINNSSEIKILLKKINIDNKFISINNSKEVIFKFQ